MSSLVMVRAVGLRRSIVVVVVGCAARDGGRQLQMRGKT